MKKRRRSNRKSIGVAVAGVLAFALAGYLIFQAMGDKIPHGKHDKAFYTVDGGATSFIDRANLEPPFDYQGKEAIRVQFFTCDGGKTRFIGWFEKFSPQAKATLSTVEHDANGNVKDINVWSSLGWDRRPMVKRPADPRWLLPHEEKLYEEATTPVCPGGADPSQLAPLAAK